MESQALPQLHALGVVSARTSLSRSALYREIKSGNLRALKVGKALRVSEDDLQGFIASLQEAKSV
jgi:excisionase family DNA binding protein